MRRAKLIITLFLISYFFDDREETYRPLHSFKNVSPIGKIEGEQYSCLSYSASDVLTEIRT